MSDEYIEKEDAIQSIIAHDLVGGNARGWAEYLLENTSTADVAPVRHGHWIKISPAGIYECSECEKNVMTSDIEAYEYCHGCGARMDGEK